MAVKHLFIGVVAQGMQLSSNNILTTHSPTPFVNDASKIGKTYLSNMTSQLVNCNVPAETRLLTFIFLDIYYLKATGIQHCNSQTSCFNLVYPVFRPKIKVMARFTSFFKPSKESQGEPRRPLSSAVPSVESRVDQSTEDGDKASITITDVTDMENSTARSINNARRNVSFKTTVLIENEENGRKLSVPKNRERGKIQEPTAMSKCEVCHKSKMKIDPATPNCDKRLKHCVKFLTMRANGEHVADYHLRDGGTHKLPNKLRSLRKFLSKHFNIIEKSIAKKRPVSQVLRQHIDQNLTADYLFEIRTLNQDSENGKRWHSYFWVPRNWDPDSPKPCSGICNKLFWRYYGGPFQVYPGHFFCPMDEIRNCHNACRTVEGTAAIKDFRLLQNVDSINVRMSCRCDRGGKNSLDQSWNVRLYKRMSKEEEKKEKENKDLEKFTCKKPNDNRKSGAKVKENSESSSWANPGLQFDSLTDDTRLVIEEANRAAKKSKDKEGHIKSLEGESGLPKIKEETNSKPQNEIVSNYKVSALLNENIAFTDHGTSQDIGLEGSERIREPQPSVTQDESISTNGSGTGRNSDAEEGKQIQVSRPSGAQDERTLAAGSESPQNTISEWANEFLNWDFPLRQVRAIQPLDLTLRNNK
ncbi:hypothetical protein BHYA_0123g00310 [Botrytis hyacinthi]|uniref:Uncharacterized protein n=1 Tax=Botrytis hyacinthi TaxID=278943 RepID=A0A4Z1GSB6_9HELO|nr:hypothetical protein BHYA_0123g00310 [Botrytis hyacinthi]